jgi:hypothetical protein
VAIDKVFKILIKKIQRVHKPVEENAGLPAGALPAEASEYERVGTFPCG